MDGQHSEFILSVLQTLEQGAKKCIELCGEYVQQIPSLVAVACFLTGRAKDLSAPTRTVVLTFRRNLVFPTSVPPGPLLLHSHDVGSYDTSVLSYDLHGVTSR